MPCSRVADQCLVRLRAGAEYSFESLTKTFFCVVPIDKCSPPFANCLFAFRQNVNMPIGGRNILWAARQLSPKSLHQQQFVRDRQILDWQSGCCILNVNCTVRIGSGQISSSPRTTGTSSTRRGRAPTQSVGRRRGDPPWEGSLRRCA